MYFEFSDVRRIHQPYTDGMIKGKWPSPRLTQTLHSSNMEDPCLQLAIPELEAWHVRHGHEHLYGK